MANAASETGGLTIKRGRGPEEGATVPGFVGSGSRRLNKGFLTLTEMSDRGSLVLCLV